MALLINYLMLPQDYGTSGAILYSLGFFALAAIWAVHVSLLLKVRSREVKGFSLSAS
jgi:hypothetical protein